MDILNESDHDGSRMGVGGNPKFTYINAMEMNAKRIRGKLTPDQATEVRTSACKEWDEIIKVDRDLYLPWYFVFFNTIFGYFPQICFDCIFNGIL